VAGKVPTSRCWFGADGFFFPHDENRPFQLSLGGGEAYRVLEVLPGDMACMLDSAKGKGAFPGFVSHDYPREADVSTGLYEDFLSLIGHLQKEQHFPFQYIVTTTTPPPDELQDRKFVCLFLDPGDEAGLLFGYRFTGWRQAGI
jgi:hypothetical protein